MKEELMEITEEFDIEDCIFLMSEIQKEDWNEVYACADHISSICMNICRVIEDQEENQ